MRGQVGTVGKGCNSNEEPWWLTRKRSTIGPLRPVQPSTRAHWYEDLGVLFRPQLSRVDLYLIETVCSILLDTDCLESFSRNQTLLISTRSYQHPLVLYNMMIAALTPALMDRIRLLQWENFSKV
jgi:hypothetical protein